MKNVVYVGMDVHKDSYSLCALDGDTGEIIGETRCAADTKLIAKFIKRLAERCGTDTEFLTGYEAGCLGYSVYHELQKLDIPCVIMAPTTMFSAAKNKAVKNDTMDAKMIAHNLVSHTYRSVYVPDREDDEVKEYLRLRKAVSKEPSRAKQQLSALLLRQGFQYSGTKTKWTEMHIEWIKELKVTPLIRLIIDEYLVRMSNLQDVIERYDQYVEELSHRERYERHVQALTCFKGISTTAAMTIHVETADFSRFPNAPAFMSYVGLNPSEHSSGEHSRLGGITKQGNSNIRVMLIECTQALVKGHIGQKGKRVRQRQLGQSAQVINYADKGVIHLQRKYLKMIEQGKQRCVAIAAVARELAGYIWGMETGNINY